MRLSFDRGTLLLTGDGVSHEQLSGIFDSGTWTWDGRAPGWRCDAYRYFDVRKRLRQHVRAGWIDAIPPPAKVTWPQLNLLPLRPEQAHAVGAWRDSDGRGQVVMPTGTGKTEVALEIMAKCAVATLVVAPVRDLMYQWHQRILRRLGYDAGIVGDSTYNLRDITVTTYDSASIHMAEIGARFGLVVFDEAHHLPGNFYREAALLNSAPFRLGLTATPERSDGRHADLDWLIGPVAYRQQISEAKGRTLADYNVVRIPVALNAEEQACYEYASQAVRTFIYERQKAEPGYTWKKLCEESGTYPEARRVQKLYFAKQAIENRAEEKLRVLEDIFRLHGGERVIVFAGSNLMALDVSRRFLVPTLLSHSRKKERLAVLEGFAEGRFPAIVANQVLDEGVDVPAAKVAVVIGGMGSTRQAKQRLGRILRRSGHARATLYEVVCENTKDEARSRDRRRSDAYERTLHRRL